jgi:hypothetical protein
VDSLDSHRRKWDILRITLETTLYASPPHNIRNGEPEILPAPLRANLMLSAPELVSQLYTRSLRLFTPSHLATPHVGFLPSQILLTLVLSALKLSCPDIARSIIEDWLGRRFDVEGIVADPEGYSKVMEMYALEVLPRLEEWEYAKEFLGYERELNSEFRQAS